MRKLSDQFVYDLKTGVLEPVLGAVHNDDTLTMSIRNDYINIYYRGGSIVRVNRKNNGYQLSFDTNYCNNRMTRYSSMLQTNPSVNDWVKNIPYMKAEMDWWFNEHPKLEREYQQLILRENNNSSISALTDYYISDVEYANSAIGCRFDLIGIKTERISKKERNGNNAQLCIMEMKYGDNALKKKSGILDHLKDINDFLKDKGKVNALFDEVKIMLKQQMDLGLITNIRNDVKINRELNPEVIFVLANHEPVSDVLCNEFKNSKATLKELSMKGDIKIARANFLGYGLFAENMISIDEFIKSSYCTEGDVEQ